MSDARDDFEQQMQRAYKQSKKRAFAPSAIRRNVLARAKKESHQPWLQMSRNLAALGGLAVSVVFIGFLFLQQVEPGGESSGKQARFVELHTLGGRVSSQQYAREVHYEQFLADYQQSQLLAKTISQQARLSIREDGSWQLDSCDQKQMVLSRDLVAMLDKHDRLSLSLSPGSIVQVSTSETGLITKIIGLQTPMMCG